ncbi:hypothetical protein ABZ307_28440 [Streptomyces griseorubiginosus]|uniref:hypothetical protein n=1 Tax=Streptomyces griseorubiginosus TaxID=67304 RepID=UPI0033B284C9
MALKDVDLKYQQGVLTTSKSLAVGGGLSVAGAAVNGIQSADHGFLAWNFDPILVQGANNTNTQGTVFLNAIKFRQARTVSNLHVYVSTAGTTITSGQNWIGLIAPDGTLLASTSMDTAFASTGLKTMAITAQSVSASWYWVALLPNMTGTAAQLLVANANGATQNLSPNIGLSAASYRCAVNGVTQTSLASITPANNSTTGAKPFWVAAS